MNEPRFDNNSCRVIEGSIGRFTQTITLENNLISLTVIPNKGAEIHSLVYKPKNINVLWKVPWNVKEVFANPYLNPDSATTWLEHYGGGWQEIFPNGGDECMYKGVKLSFHGEASLLPWDCELIEESSTKISVCFSTSLNRSPFTIVRTMSLTQNQPSLVVNELIRNEAGETMEFMWGHHPAFGAPFLSGDCVVDTGARLIQADDRYDPPSNFLPPGQEWAWPYVRDKRNQMIDISHLPSAHSNSSCLAYLTDFTEGWYAITNKHLSLGIGFVWPKEVFPYAYFWIEANASPDFPFYGRAYTVAIEPFSSIPGQGLANVIEKTGTHMSLQPYGETTFEMRVVFFENDIGVRNISSEGMVEVNDR